MAIYQAVDGVEKADGKIFFPLSHNIRTSSHLIKCLSCRFRRETVENHFNSQLTCGTTCHKMSCWPLAWIVLQSDLNYMRSIDDLSTTTGWSLHIQRR